MVIAAKTGWTEHFIRHELPLSRGNAYYHAARVMDGERCRWPGEVTASSHYVANVKNWLTGLWKKRHRTQ